MALNFNSGYMSGTGDPNLNVDISAGGIGIPYIYFDTAFSPYKEYRFDSSLVPGSKWIIATSSANSNLQTLSGVIQRGNVNTGGSQPGDFTRNIYNWLSSTFKDIWQSVGDTNLFNISGSQTVNVANTTNSGAGAVNIGTSGANSQYKLNVLGNIWLNNGRNGTIIGDKAALNATDTDLTAIGYQAGQSATNATNSVMVGVQAGLSQNGSNNVLVGGEAGGNSVSSNSVCVGMQAGQNNIASFLTALGNRAGKNNTKEDVIAIGRAAGENNTGDYAINMGFVAGQNNSGFSAINIGYLTGLDNTGINSINIGSEAGRIANGLYGINIGLEAGKSAVNNSSSIYIGTEAGRNANGFDNIGIGRSAFKNLTGPTESIAIGIFAGNATTTGSQNCFVGGGSATLNTTGEKNSYFGWRSGFQNNGSRNVLVGYSANDQSILANDNTGVGYIALHDLLDGTGNVAVGSGSLENIQTHENLTTLVPGNTYKIKLAGVTDFTVAGAPDNLTNTVFVYNGAALVGNGQLRNVTISSNYNTAIGYKSGEKVYQGSANVIIGYNSGNGSNYIGKSNQLCIANSDTNTPLLGGDFNTQELKVGGVQQFSIQYPITGVGVTNGSMFYGVDGGLYFKGGSGTVTLMAIA